MDPQGSVTPASFLRAIAARQAALHRYAAAYDRIAEEEQMHAVVGNWAEAEGAHVYAMACLRAYRAEMDDPDEAH